MNDTTQTLLRSVLKLLAGALITKGIGDSSIWETIIAGVMAISGVAWGVLHRRTFTAPLLPDSGSSVLPGYTPAPRTPPRLPLILFQLFSISAFSFFLTGCSTTNISELIKAASQDPAHVHLEVKSIYGTVTYDRSFPGTNIDTTVRTVTQ